MRIIVHARDVTPPALQLLCCIIHPAVSLGETEKLRFPPEVRVRDSSYTIVNIILLTRTTSFPENRLRHGLKCVTEGRRVSVLLRGGVNGC